MQADAVRPAQTASNSCIAGLASLAPAVGVVRFAVDPHKPGTSEPYW
jgi:hypothetical protein